MNPEHPREYAYCPSKLCTMAKGLYKLSIAALFSKKAAGICFHVYQKVGTKTISIFCALDEISVQSGYHSFTLT
jgi:hypothetical protein